MRVTEVFFKLLTPARGAGREVRRQESGGLRGSDRDAGSAERLSSKYRKVEQQRTDKKVEFVSDRNWYFCLMFTFNIFILCSPMTGDSYRLHLIQISE